LPWQIQVKHYLAVVGGHIQSASNYYQALTRAAQQSAWAGSVTFTRFIREEGAAAILAFADTVVLPFTTRGWIWHTSVHAARLQGKFVLSTSLQERGYDSALNIYWAARLMGNIVPLRNVLTTASASATQVEFQRISHRDHIVGHSGSYERLVSRCRTRGQ